MKCKRRFMHGKRRRRSPIHQNITAHTTDPTTKRKTSRLTPLKPGEGVVRASGSPPNPAKAAYDIYKFLRE